MKKPKKMLFILIFSILFFIVMIPYVGALLGVDLYRAITLKSRINKFIYQTDHQTFLTEGRQLIKDGYRGTYYFIWTNRSPGIKKFPKDIRNLNPAYVKVNDDYVVIELLGGLSDCWIMAYSEDYKEKQIGGKKIIDGLWLTSDFLHFESWDFNEP